MFDCKREELLGGKLLVEEREMGFRRIRSFWDII